MNEYSKVREAANNTISNFLGHAHIIDKTFILHKCTFTNFKVGMGVKLRTDKISFKCNQTNIPVLYWTCDIVFNYFSLVLFLGELGLFYYYYYYSDILMEVYIYPSIYTSIHLFIHLYIYLSIYLSIYSLDCYSSTIWHETISRSSSSYLINEWFMANAKI